MAVNAKLLMKTGEQFTPDMFASIIDAISPFRNGVISGCHVSVSGKEFTIGSGYLLLRGNLCEIQSGTTYTGSYTDSTTPVTRYLWVFLDLANGRDGSTISFVMDGSMVHHDSDTRKYCKLATLQVTSTTITIQSQESKKESITRSGSVIKTVTATNNFALFTSAELSQIIGIDLTQDESARMRICLQVMNGDSRSQTAYVAGINYKESDQKWYVKMSENMKAGSFRFNYVVHYDAA